MSSPPPHSPASASFPSSPRPAPSPGARSPSHSHSHSRSFGSQGNTPSPQHSRASSSDTQSVRSGASSLAREQVIASATTRKRGKAFVSQLLPEDSPPLPKPWLDVPDPRVRTSWWITVGVAGLGVALSAFLVFNGYRTLPRVGNLCPVLVEEFDGGSIDFNVWKREVKMDGFGNGEFEMTTDSDTNSFVKDGKLFILPTLTSDVIGREAVMNGYTFNLTGCTGTTSANNMTACSAVSNATAATVINPVMSARLHTKGTKSIKFGRVEVKAKMPKGDWMWPAIWMLPEDNVYGPWPASGEIDIVEARGNDMNYPAKGRNYVTSTIHWGPLPSLDLFWKTTGFWFLRRAGYDDAFHTYTLEWTEDFMWTYVDTRLHRMLDLHKLSGQKGSFWTRGRFPERVSNGTVTELLHNVWESGAPIAPFDQPFYLILNVAIGGTNGFFPDNVGGKPWFDKGPAMRDFASHQDDWIQSWPANLDDRAMQVESVKMWQRC